LTHGVQERGDVPPGIEDQFGTEQPVRNPSARRCRVGRVEPGPGQPGHVDHGGRTIGSPFPDPFGSQLADVGQDEQVQI